MKTITVLKIISATILLCCSIVLFVVARKMKPERDSVQDDCLSIPREQSTGTINCWSGGDLVYQNYIYHNGGVLCSTDGKEIKITGGKSLCVIESDQRDVWEPPIDR